MSGRDPATEVETALRQAGREPTAEEQAELDRWRAWLNGPVDPWRIEPSIVTVPAHKPWPELDTMRRGPGTTYRTGRIVPLGD